MKHIRIDIDGVRPKYFSRNLSASSKKSDQKPINNLEIRHTECCGTLLPLNGMEWNISNLSSARGVWSLNADTAVSNQNVPLASFSV